MTLYLTDTTGAGRDRAGQGVRHRPRGQVLPGRRDDEFRFRRDRARARLSGARRDGTSTDWCCRCMARSPTPTSTCSIASACSSSARSRRSCAISRASRSCSSTSRPREAADFVAAAPATRRRDDHAAAPSLLAQRAVRRRHPAAPLLPADPEARDASPGARRGRDLGQSEVLPRHRLGAARAAHEGERLRLRRLLLRAGGAAALRRGLRRGRGARPARRLRQPLRRRLLRAAAQRRQRDARREPWTVPAEYPCGEHTIVPLRAGETVHGAWRAVAPCAPRPRDRMRRAIRYPCRSEASQTVAARATGGRKVRAPQSRMPGNARTL